MSTLTAWNGSSGGRRVLVVATVAALLGGAVAALGGAPEARAATVDTSAWYVLVNRNSGKALDDYNFATNDGARVTQWTRTDADNQQFSLADSDNGYVRLINRTSGKAVEFKDAATTDNANIVQYQDRNAANQ